MHYELIDESNEQPIQLTDVQEWCVLDESDEALTQNIIELVVSRFQHHTRRQLINATFELTRHCFDYTIPLRKPMVSEIVSVKYIDDAGTEQTVDPSNYRLIGPSASKNLVFKSTFELPSNLDDFEAVKIQLVAGYGEDFESIPSDIRGCIAMSVANIFEQRGEDPSKTQIPEPAKAIMDAYKIIEL